MSGEVGAGWQGPHDLDPGPPWSLSPCSPLLGTVTATSTPRWGLSPLSLGLLTRKLK